ncbi:MAG TPA: hypothetical protein VG276_25790 [Actinomycetes bacterium]|nr:hypothetical protein [Actinomycetes bacterium]
MRMVFGPDDEKEFFDVRDELTEQFATWAEANAPAADPWLAQLALDYKWGYGDGELGRWTGADLRDLLCGWFPRKVTLDEGDLDRVVPSLRSFVDYLAAAGLLDPRGDRPARLRAVLDGLGPEFQAAMRDPSRFGMAKSFASAMMAGGVDMSDEAAVSRFMAEFNDLPFEARKLFTELPGQPVMEFPPVRLPPEAELAAAAAAAPAVERLRRFAAWLGPGRKLTQAGRLTLADGKDLVEVLSTGDEVDPRIGNRTFRTRSSEELPGVSITFAWAKAARLARVVHGRVVPNKRGQALLDRPLELWERALEGLGKVGPTLLDRGIFVSFLADDFGELVPTLLGALYASDEPVPLDDLADAVWQDVRRMFLIDQEPAERVGLWRDMTAADVNLTLGQLEELGAVERLDLDPASPNLEPASPNLEPASSNLDPASRNLDLASRNLDLDLASPNEDEEGAPTTGFRLTPLGTWATNRILRADGADAPVVGDLADADAATLLERCAGYDEASCQAEIAAWCAARGPAVAAEQLAAYARTTNDVEGQMLALTALDAAGPEGVEAVQGLREVPGLGPLATMWLIDHGLADSDDLDPEMVLAVMVETTAFVLATEGPEAAAAAFARLRTPAEQAELVGNLWRVDSPRTAGLLAALAEAHPDKAVAKAARKAAFKLRSSGR